jgi:hypothetical protein
MTFPFEITRPKLLISKLLQNMFLPAPTCTLPIIDVNRWFASIFKSSFKGPECPGVGFS